MSETKIDRLCRTCMNDSNSHSPIYRELCREDSMLFEVINDVCQLEVAEGDGLPEYICHNCLNKLSEFQNFKCRAHEVNVALQRMKEHELNSVSESLPWESYKTEDDSNFEQENDGSDLGSKELCGSTLALHHDWIKPDYSATEHEKDDVNPAGVDQVEVKVEPEDSFDEASDGREDTPYEEYIGIEPDELAYNDVGFDGTTSAATDPLQLPVNVTELKQESFSPERSHPTKDTFLTDGLKEEDLSPEAMPVDVTPSSTNGTLKEEKEADEEPGGESDEMEMMNTVKENISCNRKLTDKSEGANSVAATARIWKTEAKNRVEGMSDGTNKVYKGTQDVVIQNGNLEKMGMANSHGGVDVQEGNKSDTQLRFESLTGEKHMEHLSRSDSCFEETKAGSASRDSRWYFCDLCRKGFGEKCSLGNHMRIHMDLDPIGCVICEGSTSKGVARLRVEEMGGVKACQVCGKDFMGEFILEAHVRGNHSSDGKMSVSSFKQKRFFCYTCGTGFNRKDNLATHVRKHSVEKPSRYKCDPSVENYFKCSLCGKRFVYQKCLTRHVKMHEVPQENKLACTVCGKRFLRKGHLNNHLTTHSDERPFLCNVCGKMFKLPERLNVHLMQVHGNDRQYRCDICGKEFFRKSRLVNHTQSHGDERPYPCEICGKKFKSKNVVGEHRRIHSGNKPHCCSFCPKRFLNKGVLNEHLRTHTGEKPFECENCGGRFSQYSGLFTHKKSYCKNKVATI